jgi:hypothetical protein
MFFNVVPFSFIHRAPVMVAVALIELGMRYEDAVEMIRL